MIFNNKESADYRIRIHTSEDTSKVLTGFAKVEMPILDHDAKWNTELRMTLRVIDRNKNESKNAYREYCPISNELDICHILNKVYNTEISIMKLRNLGPGKISALEGAVFPIYGDNINDPHIREIGIPDTDLQTFFREYFKKR